MKYREYILNIFNEYGECIDTVDCDSETLNRHLEWAMSKYSEKIRFQLRIIG